MAKPRNELESGIGDILCEMAEINLYAPYAALLAALDKMDMGDIQRNQLMTFISDECSEFVTNQHKWCDENNIA